MYVAAARLPFDYYGEVCDPSVLPPEGPAIGSLADDLADIDRDVVGGLRAFLAGRPAAAAEAWETWLWGHWGGHATGAIRALHAWLAANPSGRPAGA